MEHWPGTDVAHYCVSHLLVHDWVPKAQTFTNLDFRHRLSTITHADQIIVLNAGAVIEKGTHDELLTKNGRYASMWERQIRAERALDAAREAHLKAARAMRRANMRTETQTVASRDEYNSMASSETLSSVIKPGVDLKSEELTSSSSSGSHSSSDAESTHTDERSEDHDEPVDEPADAGRRIYERCTSGLARE